MEREIFRACVYGFGLIVLAPIYGLIYLLRGIMYLLDRPPKKENDHGRE